MNSKLLVTVLAMCLVACGKPNNGGTGGGSGGSGGSSTGGGGGRAGGSGGGSGTGGGMSTGGGSGGGGGAGGGATMGTSCANAISVTPGTMATSVLLDAPGKKVYYKVAATAGDFFVMFTAANPNDDPALLDATISVYNEAGTTLLATVDDAYPRDTTDTTLFYRAEATGNLCVVLMDFATWYGPPEMSTAHAEDPKLFIGKMNDMAPSSNHDTGTNDTAAMPQTGKLSANMAGTASSAYVYGMLESGTDVDVYKFTLPAGQSSFTVNLMPINSTTNTLGTNSYGSSLSHVALKVTDAAGTNILGQVSYPTDLTKRPDSLNVPGGTGDVLLWIERPAGVTAGTNDFYVMFLTTFADNPAEMMDTTNDVVATAEPLTLTVSTTNPKAKTGFILGTMSSLADVDTYSFAVGANDKLSLFCAAERDGSGLRGTKYELTDLTTSLQSDTETNAANVEWYTTSTGLNGSQPAYTFTTAGTYYLKVTSGTPDATNTSRYYRCGMSLLSP